MDIQFYRKASSESLLRRILKALWSRRALRWSIIIGVPILLFVTFSEKGIIQRMKLHAVKKEWEDSVRTVEAEQLHLRELSKKLDEESVEKDSSARELVEKIAREKHGMIRPGETVYRVKKGK